MLSLQGLLTLINDRGYREPKHLVNWRRIYYGMSLHIDGICPAYRPLRYASNVWALSDGMVYPFGWGGMEYQVLFEDYLFSKHPHEPEITRQWRLSQYKPFTREMFLKAIQVITGAIFQDSGYTIECSDKDDNDYIWGNNFEGKNLVQYLTHTFQNICEDPNGVYVVIPEQSAKNTTNDVRPKIHFIKSKFIKWHTEDEIVFYKDDLIWVANRFGYFRFQKDDKEQWNNVDDSNGYYVHMLGYKPVITAGGIWNAQGHYDSWLQAAKPLADEYVGGMSGEQMVMKQASHPFITVAESTCPDCKGAGGEQVPHGCEGGHCDVCQGQYVLKTCTTCKGSGTMSHNPGDWQVVPADQMSNDLIKITNPDTGINKLHIDRNAQLKKAIYQALHIDVIDQAQSGAAKALDMETRYQFIANINNDLFDRLIPRLIDAILSLRNVQVAGNELRPITPEYTLVKPTQFQIKTSYDLLMEYTEAAKDLPDFMLGEYLNDLADKQFGGNDVLKKKTRIITQMDKVSQKKDGDMQIIAVNGWVAQRDIQLHYALPAILDDIIREFGDDRFLRSDYESIKAEVDRRFALMIPPPIQIQPEVIDENRV
jgi:hypothetical protein